MTDHPPPTPPRPPKADGPVDMHVHVVGNGMGGTGCWTRLPLWRRPMAGIMLRQAGLPASALHGDLDRLFADRLLEWVRASSLSAAVILAHDQVYSERGELIEGVGTFHVPNAYVLELARQHGEFLPAISIHPARPDALEELERCLAGAGQDIVGDVQDMVTFVIGQMDLEQVQVRVNLLHQAQALGEGMNGPSPPQLIAPVRSAIS